MKSQITHSGLFNWHWVVYPDPLVCRDTDPHGRAAFKWLAERQVRITIAKLKKQ